ncbi:MAG TPA: hypothetical protein VH088_07085 [Terriglobales bacterium]|jgi:hypothetical protein|nr:hypothetical protein [Terriglobales bacterium]
MRWSSLLLLIFVTPAFGQSPSGNSKDFDLLTKPAKTFNISKPKAAPYQWREPDSYAVGMNEVCFTVRTYVAEREDPESDVTRVVGSSSCEWSSKFAVKTAEIKVR